MQDGRKVDALLRFHYKEDPATWDDTTYWRRWYDLLYAREQEREMLLGVLRQVINEAFPPTSA